MCIRDSYYPPTDDNSILNGDHWYRINTSDPNFYPNSTQREQILANSENHALSLIHIFMVVVIDVDDFTHLAIEKVVEGTLLQECA